MSQSCARHAQAEGRLRHAQAEGRLRHAQAEGRPGISEEMPHGSFHSPGHDERPSVVARILSFLIVLYQHSLSLLLGPRCRFYPSCSQYARECLHKYPLQAAVAKTTKRLLRCHPLHPGGIDLP